jgi:hypothetical protein
MLTKYHPRSSFKKKFTVVVIWLTALFMTFLLIKTVREIDINFLWLIAPSLMALVMIAGILLRCKIARWFTLLTLYTLLLTPFVALIVVQESLSVNILLGYPLLFILIIYVFSNQKAMDLFYIESKPFEHLPLVVLAVVINVIYFQYLR